MNRRKCADQEMRVQLNRRDQQYGSGQKRSAEKVLTEGITRTALRSEKQNGKEGQGQ